VDSALALRLRWLPFALLRSAPDEGRPLPVLLELRLPPGETDWRRAIEAETAQPVATWTIDGVLKNFAFSAFAWYERTQTNVPHVPDEKLIAWIAAARDLAARFPFPIGAVEAADRLEQTRVWANQFFAPRSSGLDTTADRHFRTNLNLWAIDQIIRAVNAIEPPEILHIPVTEIWPTIFEGFDKMAIPFADYAVAHRRIARLVEDLKPRRADALMIELLQEALTFGPLTVTGDLRYSATPPK